MENKTCGECRYYHPVWEHEGVCTIDETLDKTCDWEKCAAWQKKEPLSNGDKIRQGGNIELFIYWQKNKCLVCAFDRKACSQASCYDGMMEWLNAPAENNTAAMIKGIEDGK